MTDFMKAAAAREAYGCHSRCLVPFLIKQKHSLAQQPKMRLILGGVRPNLSCTEDDKDDLIDDFDNNIERQQDKLTRTVHSLGAVIQHSFGLVSQPGTTV